jgi:enoyl-CoA hydratase/carnithine racemase
MTFTEILVSVENAVATITLNRPARLNAWTQTMEREVRAALTAAGADQTIRAVVVTGAGRGFCGGADMSSLDRAATTEADLRSELAYPVRGMTGIEANYDKRLSYILRIPKPVIAAINGPVAGIGVCLALFCDIRFITQGAKLTTVFAERGLIAEHGSAWMLPRLIGPMNALSLLCACKPISAEEVAGLGLARLLPAANFLQTVQSYALDIANRSSPRSLGIIKRQIYDGLMQTFAESTDGADEEMFLSFGSEDFQEGIAHYVEKRPPHFSGR